MKPQKIVNEDTVEYLFHNKNGDAQFFVYNLYPGIDFLYCSVHMDVCDFELLGQETIVEIGYCLEGRLEQKTDNGFCYLVPGDISVSVCKGNVHNYRFPLHHYHGIAVVIHTEIAQKRMASFLHNFGIDFVEASGRLKADSRLRIIRKNDSLKYAFNELQKIPKQHRKELLRIKVLEFLFYFSKVDIDDELPLYYPISEMQAVLAKSVAEYLKKNPMFSYSVEELAHRFHVSKAYLQNAFKGVYGVTVHAYMRIQQMRLAASRLVHSNDPIIAIAAECGYTNPSKFAEAFKKIIGESPSDYRKIHRIYHTSDSAPDD